MQYFGIEKSFRVRFNVFDQFADKMLGLTAARRDKNAVTCLDMTKYIFRFGKFFRIFLA